MAGCVARGCCFGECAELSSAKQISNSRGVLHRRKLRGRVRGVAASWKQNGSQAAALELASLCAGGEVGITCSVRVRGRSLARRMQTIDCSTTESGTDPAEQARSAAAFGRDAGRRKKN